MIDEELKELLDFKAEQYNNTAFVADDPVLVPHLFTEKGDIEVSAFLTAIISWGQRTTIINNAKRLMELMDDSPFDFVMNHTKNDLYLFDDFVHRTLNSTDLKFILRSLQNILRTFGTLETPFIIPFQTEENLYRGIGHFRDLFFGMAHPVRTLKHIPNIEKGSTGKRLNMFLRWMVRNDKKGVDFGIWKHIKPSQLYLPLDVHTANASKKLGLLTRKANDWKAVLEVTLKLRELDPEDPVKYDFALFGLSRFDKI
ncbi:TIGR02757 family protein [Saccharicrinis sp. FJH54]|uniref:TIGR02757 family protein n=1 Tax=Saccharicrinis sp. FJH54 TaxID=3344665 RepID=UPI0035D44CB1